MIDQTHMEYFREHMSDEEKIAAQESLKATYGPPIEFYTFFRRRAIKNSSSAIYKFSRACILTGDDGVSQPQANFLLPRMDRLALDAKSGSLVILFISFAGAQNSQSGIDSSKIHSGNIGGHCLWSKIPLESLYSSWKEYPNMDLGEKATSVSLVEMQPCFLQLMSMSEKFVEIQVPSNPLTSSSPQQVQVTISAQEVGATENPPYRSSFSFSDFPASSVVLPIHRLRKGQVAFNYSYYNNKLQKTEVTGDFTCPLCKVKCASFKGLECHIATHDFFNFEFWVNEKYPAVNVSLNEVTLTEVSASYFQNNIPNALSMKSSRRKQKTPVRNPRPRPIKTDDAADSVKCEKSQTVPPGMGPADLQMMNMWNSFMKKHRYVVASHVDVRRSQNCTDPSWSEIWTCSGNLTLKVFQRRKCWKKYIWTLKIYGRLDAQTLNNCMVLFEQLPVEDTEAFILIIPYIMFLSNGDVVSYKERSRSIRSPLIAEGLALRSGVVKCRELGFQRVLFQSDCIHPNYSVYQVGKSGTKKSRRKRQKRQVGNLMQGPHLGLGCEVIEQTDGMCLIVMNLI
ncbi:hypothetical protein YC2023_027866 [Brassica napus]